MLRNGEISVIQKVHFWSNPAIRVRKARFRTGKITYRIDRQLPTHSGPRRQAHTRVRQRFTPLRTLTEIASQNTKVSKKSAFLIWSSPRNPKINDTEPWGEIP